MDREKLRKQSFNLRNKKSITLGSPKPKVTKGVIKVDSFSTKKNVDTKGLTQQQKAAKTIATLKEARSRKKPGGCGRCSRKISE